MSQREKRKLNKKRERGQDPGPITRRQQVAAIRQIKGQEIATAVASSIRKAVKQEVETQLKAIKDTMLDLIDRVLDCEARQNAVLMQRVKDEVTSEGDGDDRPERAEGSEVLEVDEVVPDKGLEGEDRNGEDGTEGPTSG
jgi:hypothetical protein